MNDFSIIYASNKAVCFKINSNIYFLKLNEELPQLYNQCGKNMHIANIDYWLNINTKNEYSLKSLLKIAAAFLQGMSLNYDIDDLRWIVDKTVNAAIKELISKTWLHEFNLKYWIEAQSEENLKIYVDKIRQNISIIKEKIGEEKLKNDLMRLYHVALVRNIGLSGVCEELINDLGYEIKEPEYPSTELSQEFCNSVKEIIFKNSVKHKNLDPRISQIIDGL